MPNFNVSTLFTLKYPLQYQFHTRECHIFICLVFFNQIVSVAFFIFNLRL